MTPQIPRYLPGAFRRFGSFLFILLLSFATGWPQSQSGSISGSVTDSAGAPLGGAIITIAGTNRETVSGRDGTYHLPNVPAGSQTVHVSYLGFTSKDYPVTVTDGQHSLLEAKMGDDLVQLDKFTVEGQRAGQARALNQQRASDNLKSIVSSDALGRFPDQNAAETLGRIAGRLAGSRSRRGALHLHSWRRSRFEQHPDERREHSRLARG